VFTRAHASVPLAKAAAYDALCERAKDATPAYDSQKEMLKERVADSVNNIRYRYHFEDEAAKININIATSDILQRLPGIESKILADAIVNSARRPFKVKEEILLVEGMTKDKFRQCKDLITVYGDGKININTAGAGVLSALGLEEGLIEIILRYRSESPGPDGEQDTEDDGAFLSASGVLSELRGFNSLSLTEEQQLISVTNLLAVKSRITGVSISADIRGKAGNTYLLVIDTENKKIAAWNE
jgi:DNA uptake protein ComE-like DNA-binding protein